ncbi:MAG TPA: pseudaminic acid synthase [Puia sp.]|nr:pseudaminic acid synthase [Puia sp.]
MKNIQIAGRQVGGGEPPFIIAEMSGNHNQSIERAMQIITAASNCGVHAIKLQTYTPDTMTIPGALTIDDPGSIWNGRELYDLYKEAYTPWEWHAELFDFAKSLNLIPFSTPFDETAVDFLESLNVPCYKIASFENSDWPLLEKVARTGKPVIMSSGAATVSEIGEAVEILKNAGCEELILLKCTSTYPATPQNTNLLTIPHMRELFNCPIGLSDHTMGIGVAVASVALGACVIEKHFTLRRADGGVDSAFSMEPGEMSLLVSETEKASQAMGVIQYGVQESEKQSLAFKRSIYVVRDIAKGEAFNKVNIRVIRPGNGLAPKFYKSLIGKTAQKNYPAGTPLSWENIL